MMLVPCNTDTPEHVALLCRSCINTMQAAGFTAEPIQGYDLSDVPPEHRLCDDCGARCD